MDKQSSTLQHDSNGTSTGSRKLTLTNNISSTETTEERLRQHEKSWSAEKAKLTTVIEKYKQQMVQAEETQRNTQIEIENLKMQLESALTSLQGMQNKLAASQEETVAAKKEAEQMDEKCSDLEDEAVRALEKLQKEHTKQLDARDGHIRQLLNQAMAGKAEGRWNPTPDGETRRQLAVLNNEIRSFSKEWAATSLEALESLMKVPVVARYYSRFVRVSQGHLPPSLRKVSPKMLEKLPAVLLNAAVADEVQDSFFGNPFFCISVEAQPAFKKIFIDLVKGKSARIAIKTCSDSLQLALRKHINGAVSFGAYYARKVSACNLETTNTLLRLRITSRNIFRWLRNVSANALQTYFSKNH